MTSRIGFAGVLVFCMAMAGQATAQTRFVLTPLEVKTLSEYTQQGGNGLLAIHDSRPGPGGSNRYPNVRRFENSAAIVGQHVVSKDMRAGTGLVERTANTTIRREGFVRFSVDRFNRDSSYNALTLEQAWLTAGFDPEDRRFNTRSGTTGPMAELREVTQSTLGLVGANQTPSPANIVSRTLRSNEARHLGATAYDVTGLMRRWMASPRTNRGFHIVGGIPTRETLSAQGLQSVRRGNRGRRDHWVRQRQFKVNNDYWEFVSMHKLDNFRLTLQFASPTVRPAAVRQPFISSPKKTK